MLELGRKREITYRDLNKIHKNLSGIVKGFVKTENYRDATILKESFITLMNYDYKSVLAYF